MISSDTPKSSLFAKLITVSDVHKLVKTSYLRYRRFVKTADNNLLLDPNHGQVLKLGRYSLGLTAMVKLGKQSNVFMSDSPATTIRVKRVIVNVPCPGFLYLSTLLTANVSTAVGGSEDAWAYSAFSNVEVDYPTLPPSQKLTVSGHYTGLCVLPYRKNTRFLIAVSVFGPSTIAGGF